LQRDTSRILAVQRKSGVVKLRRPVHSASHAAGKFRTKRWSTPLTQGQALHHKPHLPCNHRNGRSQADILRVRIGPNGRSIPYAARENRASSHQGLHHHARSPALAASASRRLESLVNRGIHEISVGQFDQPVIGQVFQPGLAERVSRPCPPTRRRCRADCTIYRRESSASWLGPQYWRLSTLGFNLGLRRAALQAALRRCSEGVPDACSAEAQQADNDPRRH